MVERQTINESSYRNGQGKAFSKGLCSWIIDLIPSQKPIANELHIPVVRNVRQHFNIIEIDNIMNFDDHGMCNANSDSTFWNAEIQRIVETKILMNHCCWVVKAMYFQKICFLRIIDTITDWFDFLDSQRNKVRLRLKSAIELVWKTNDRSQLTWTKRICGRKRETKRKATEEKRRENRQEGREKIRLHIKSCNQVFNCQTSLSLFWSN
jgi:hypothetical protein